MKTMGQRFREARERKKLTLSRAAAISRIKIQLIEGMEVDDFSKMPAPAYAKGFIKLYAELLDLDPAPLLAEYQEVHLEGKPRQASAAVVPPSQPEPEPVIGDEPVDTPAAPLTAGGVNHGKPAPAVVQLLATFRNPFILILLFLVTGLNRCLGSSAEKRNSPEDPRRLLQSSSLLAEPPPPYLPSGNPESKSP
ncbi:MAG: helix-turn-helix domain-containing protein [Kiritimatiellae bacterium]|nr:helix-turn-helix domain-containing protein [Kiritimatiellia bacterium]